MSAAKKIITLLGGIRPTARRLNHTHHSTVQGWKDRGAIPPRHWSSLIALAADDGVVLSCEHFLGRVPLPSEPETNNPTNESAHP